MFSVAELDKMEQIKIEEADRSTLVNIQTIKVDTLQSTLERMEHYLEQIKNPYCFLCDGSVVKIRFAQNGTELKSRLENYFVDMKKS